MMKSELNKSIGKIVHSKIWLQCDTEMLSFDHKKSSSRGTPVFQVDLFWAEQVLDIEMGFISSNLNMNPSSKW